MRLHDQIVAVERATNSSRAIDGDVIELLNLQPQGFVRAGGSQPDLFRDKTGAARVQTWLAPKLTASMDAAAETITPGWRINALSDPKSSVRARCILENHEGSKVVGYACNRASAILAASLRAKAFDRGSPMPRSSEQVADLETAVHPDRERPKLHITA